MPPLESMSANMLVSHLALKSSITIAQQNTYIAVSLVRHYKVELAVSIEIPHCDGNGTVPG